MTSAYFSVEELSPFILIFSKLENGCNSPVGLNLLQILSILYIYNNSKGYVSWL